MEPTTHHSLAILRRQYFQLVEPANLGWPEAKILKLPCVQYWLYQKLFDQANLPSPPPELYRQRILKTLVAKLEAAIDDPEEDEISDDLMSAMSSLMGSALPSEAVSAQQKAFVTYTFPERPDSSEPVRDPTVTLFEARSVISASGTTGLRTWEAALVLGSYLSSTDGRQIVRGKTILELGAGTGMLSILCAKYLDVTGVTATDGDEGVVDAIKTNAFLNGLDPDQPDNTILQSAVLRWGWPINKSTFQEDYGMEIPDVLLGADLTYDRSVIPRLVGTLREFFDSNSSLQAFISATIRNEQTFETFLNACRRNRFGLDQIEFPLTPEPAQDGPFYPTSTPIQIWKITTPDDQHQHANW